MCTLYRCSQMFPDAPMQMLPDAPRCSQMLPDEMLPDAPMPPDAPRCCRMLPDAAGCSQMLPDAPRCAHMLPDAARCSQMLPDAPRSPQMLQYIYIYIYVHNTYIIRYTNSFCPHGFALCHVPTVMEESEPSIPNSSEFRKRASPP